ncbi:DUF3817 domain-containing protein [Mucilaginibacter sp. PAMB04274]|uniref:DUF3817 domain-containing protein n=1 Tax=Mucilaginibacter sp. PAMB04274 TaxID=3138568 RepID=UPI0031F6993F
MNNLIKTSVGRLRLVGYLEGTSLIMLLFIGVPLKYYSNNPVLVKTLGPVHGLLFLYFVISTLSVGVEQNWKFRQITWKVLIACMIPFGTFYIDYYILKQAAKSPN